MRTNPQTTGSRWFTAEWLYDAIMRHIDTDLVTSALPMLTKKYAGESDLDNAKRRMRYELSFRTFDRALQAFEERFMTESRAIRDLRRDALSMGEMEERAEDLEQIQSKMIRSTPQQ